MVNRPSRRGFMLELTGAAAFPPTALASLDEFSAALGAAPGGEAYWEQVRRQFPFREEKVPMNAANLCPSPRVVADRVTQLTQQIDADCSFNNRAKFKELLEASRRKAAEQLGVTADEIALVRNTSEANNTINNGLPLEAGDEIILWDQNHPTNNVAWDVRAARFDLTVKRVSTPPQPEGIDQLVETFAGVFGPKTRVLAITHASNVSGVRLPVRELCDVAHRRGVYVHVDGAQTWGALDVLRQLGCDSYSASAHKSALGPKEVGLLYVKRDRIGRIWPNTIAPGWGEDTEPDVVGARKFESLGQRDDAALAAIAVAVEFQQAIGQERIEQRIQELARAVKNELFDAGLKLVTPLQPELSAGVCIIDAPRQRRAEICDKLYEIHGIAGSTSGGLRLCPHIYNTMDHVQRAIAAVNAMRNLIR